MTVVITGAAGMLGRSVLNAYRASGNHEVVGLSRNDFDLRQAHALKDFLEQKNATTLIHCAAKVGGIGHNVSYPVAYLEENLAVDHSVLMTSLAAGVKNLLYIGSSCMYPKDLSKSLGEEDLLSGTLEPTNESYALAKIVGSKLCEYISREFGLNFRTVIASNLYGQGDNFDAERGHLVASVIRKTLDAMRIGVNRIEVWGDGKARREFTYVEDLAHWIVSATENMVDLPQYLNVGAGVDYSVDEYYNMAMNCLGVKLSLVHDLSKPNGMHSKLMNSSKARTNHNWNPKTTMVAGMTSVIESLRK